MPLLGEPMLARQIERLHQTRSIDRLIVATTTMAADDAIVSLAASLGIRSYRGSMEDVLDRFYRAAAPYQPSHVVRLTADCPLADWDVIDRVVEFGLSGDFDYASNTVRPTWPNGLDAEIMKFGALEAAWQNASSPVDREHVTQFFLKGVDQFKVGSLENDPDLSLLRWTVDEFRDFEFVTRIYEALYPSNKSFSTADILELLQVHPELTRINSGIKRNEGLQISIEKFERGVRE